MSLPQCNTGFVYMLVSTQVTTYSYIGETRSIVSRLDQHNSGFGSESTCPISLRPFAVFSYVCGFDGDKQTRCLFEYVWKCRIHDERMSGMICLKQFSKLSAGIISLQTHGINSGLRLKMNFKD